MCRSASASSPSREVPEPLQALLERLPADAHPMDVLRTGCSALGCLEPERRRSDEQKVADRLLAMLPGILLYWYHYSHDGHRIDTRTRQPSLAGHFLELLHGSPPAADHQRAMDVSLILYAEHEFNASTFAARVAASTLADFYSPMTAAIGTLRGWLHGGANEAALALIGCFVDPQDAEAGLLEALAWKQRIMGFGHRVYTVSDPRSEILKPWARRLAEETGKLDMYAVCEQIEAVMWREKRLFPNVDFWSALVYHCLEIPPTMFTPIFVFARTAGWSAHIFEQREDNKLIRPAAEYAGPGPQAWLPINERNGATPRFTARTAVPHRNEHERDIDDRQLTRGNFAERSVWDQVLVDIADCALAAPIESRAAYETARLCLMDGLGCGLLALGFVEVSADAGTGGSGAVLPGGRGCRAPPGNSIRSRPPSISAPWCVGWTTTTPGWRPNGAILPTTLVRSSCGD